MNKDTMVDRLREYTRLAVAFSGGVDSALVLSVAREVLGKENILSISAATTLAPLDDVVGLPQQLGVRQLTLSLDPLLIPEVAGNTIKRCYHCKRYVMGSIVNAARSNGFLTVADGTQLTDTQGYRPGQAANHELKIFSPLLEAGFTKSDVRELASDLCLPQADKPATPCLATRVPYDMTLTPKILVQVGAAERILRKMGFPECRVRYHGEVARIEVPEGEQARLLSVRPQLVPLLQSAGFSFVAVDLLPLRGGCFDRVLGLTQKTPNA